MIAVETNLLVYAHREDMDEHQRVAARLSDLASSGQPWAIPWPCVHEFIGTVTRPRYFDPPSTLHQAIRAMARWMESAGLVLLHEGPSHFEALSKIAVQAGARGALIHDARIVAICIANGVSELWSADRDFSRFPELKIVNPLVRAA